MKIAIVHDYLHTYGGAERVLEALHEMYPEAPVYTSVFYANKLPSHYSSWDIHTSFLQRLPRFLLPFFKPVYPLIFEGLNLNKFDLVISCTAGVAKGLITFPDVAHISYTHTVPKAVWHIESRKGLLKRFALHKSRIWDFSAAQRVDYFVANSENVNQRIKKYYRRKATTIYPPVEITKLREYVRNEIKKEDYFVMVGRLEEYKGTVKVAQVLKGLGYHLKVIGTGPEEKKLKSFEPFVEILGPVSDEVKAKTIAGAKALIYWAHEDFGITMAESIALGTPVIAYQKGGSIEIINNENGMSFDRQTISSLTQVMQQFDADKFDKEKIMQSADKFSKENFKKSFTKFVDETLESYKIKIPSNDF